MNTSTTVETSTTLNRLIEKTAEGFFDYVRPSILMIGEWDDLFTIIKSQYRWATHRHSVPGRIDRETALIVTNYRHYYEHILSLIHNMDINTAILVYDETDTIPDAKKIKHTNLTCYLATVSPRYINGHIRTMLQLKRWYLGNHGEYPIIVSNPVAIETFHKVLQSLDFGQPVSIIGNDPYFIYLVIKLIAAKTHYEALVYIESPDQFEQVASHEYTTLVLNVTCDQDLIDYAKKPLMEYSVIFVGTKKLQSDIIGSSFALNQADMFKNDYRLLAYFHSLQENLSDPSNRTRFIQSGDINTLYDDSDSYLDFYTKIKKVYQEDSIKFRNIAPMIHGVSYGNSSLHVLIDELTNQVYQEFFKQTNNALEHAEMVSGISRSTLQPILGKIKNTQSDTSTGE